jgi:MYXO-CTERM domain-containing protein
VTWVAAVALVAVGVLAVRYGQADDSPGMGGIGLLLVLAAVVLVVRRARRS